jgi:regulation of enolase protein 1 (concanavalin A-like superfamily)
MSGSARGLLCGDMHRVIVFLALLAAACGEPKRAPRNSAGEPDSGPVGGSAGATGSPAAKDAGPALEPPRDAASLSADTARPVDAPVAVDAAPDTRPAANLPAPWKHVDVGDATLATGSTSFANGTFTISGSGSDIWNASDGFAFVARPFSGDGEIVARVASIEQTDFWSKAGVMIRASLAPGSRHAMMIISGSGMSSFQFRATDDGGSVAGTPGNTAAPRWVKLSRAGRNFRGYVSADGKSWALSGSTVIDMPADVQIGLVTSSHIAMVLAMSTIDGVAVTTYPPYPTGLDAGVAADAAPGTPPPAPWTTGDVGAVGQAGLTRVDKGTFTQIGSGADIWDASDSFTYAFQPRTGDFSITARVVSVENTDGWAKAGVMVRATLDAASEHAMVVGTAGNGVHFQFRPSAGAGSTDSPTTLPAVPAWVRLTRAGTTVTAAASTDGTTWMDLGTTELAAANVYVGLVTTAHNNALAAKAVLDNVSVAGK